MQTHNARTNDPASSHIAGYEAESSGRAANQRAGVLGRFKQSPNMTSKQLGEKYAHEGYDRYVFARRLPELEEESPVNAATDHSRIAIALQETKTKLTPVPDLPAKLAVLDKLTLILDPSISQVLSDVADYLRGRG